MWSSAQGRHSLWTRNPPLELEPAPLWVGLCLCEHMFPFPFLGKSSGGYISSGSPKGTEVLGVYIGVRVWQRVHGHGGQASKGDFRWWKYPKLSFHRASLAAQTVKNPPAMQETRVPSSGPQDGQGNPLQCSCLENPRDGSLGGCRLWDHTEPDTTEAT